MAKNLFSCPDCDHLVSHRAAHCPSCGHQFLLPAQPGEGLFLRMLNLVCLLSFVGAATLALVAVGLWALAALASTRL